MAIEFHEAADGRILYVNATGKLAKADYERWIPEMEQLIKRHGKLRILFEMRDFHGWEAGALWEDLKFDLKHFKDIERLAMVGDKRWEHGMAVFCKPFTTAKVRYFDQSQSAEAKTWLEAEMATHVGAK